MKITQISATYERKINLGDYNSAHVGVTLTADLEPGDDPAQAARALFDEARGQVKAVAVPLLKQKSATVEEVFNGLPVDAQQQIRGGR